MRYSTIYLFCQSTKIHFSSVFGAATKLICGYETICIRRKLTQREEEKQAKWNKKSNPLWTRATTKLASTEKWDEI